MNEITIARAAPADAVGIQILLRDASHDMYINAGYTEDDVAHRFKDSLSKESITRLEQALTDPKDELYLIAKDKEQVCGLCYIEKTEQKNILHAMYVLPKYQGRGLAHQLWEKATCFLDQEKSTYLNVIGSNEKAINFYKKLGFKETDQRGVDEALSSLSGVTIEETEMIKLPTSTRDASVHY